MTVHVDMEEYVRDARELLADCLDEAAVDAVGRLKEGMGFQEAAELMGQEVRSSMRHLLFSKVKSEHIVDPGYSMMYIPGTGIYRRRPRELTASAMPSRLLDVKRLIPDLPDIIGEAMLAASRKAMEERILETAAGAAAGPGSEG